MSLGYAQKLSYREDVGTVGMSELFDPSEILEQKVQELANMMKKSKHLVAFTGAGISTSCGIPDFRGPKGVWTLQHEGKGVPESSLPFHCATPSLTHMALVELEKIGMLKFVISQNVDCLHLRSGMPRAKLAELHGNSFRELCSSCGEEYIRDFEIETIGMKATSRLCSRANCGAKLQDTVLDWESHNNRCTKKLKCQLSEILEKINFREECYSVRGWDALPEKEMDIAEKQCKAADIVLCLGTSLQITPACNLPLKCIRGGGKFVIVNLQQTPKDKKASLVIHGLVDKVIAGVMQILNLRIPPYVRVDLIQLYLSNSQKSKKNVKWTIRISSSHGLKAPLPFLKSVEVSFPGRPTMKTAVLHTQPFCLIRDTKRSKPFKMALKLNFGEGCGCQSSVIEWPVNFLVTFESFRHEKEAIFEKLKVTALDDLECGQNAVIERNVSPRNETSTHAIVTNFRIYRDSIVPKACETNTSDNRSSDMHNSSNIAGETEENLSIGETAPSDNRHNSGNGDMDMPLEKVDGIQNDTSDDQAPSSKILKSVDGDLKMLTAEVDADDVSENFGMVKSNADELSKEATCIKNSGRGEIIDTTKEIEGSVLC